MFFLIWILSRGFVRVIASRFVPDVQTCFLAKHVEFLMILVDLHENVIVCLCLA